MPAAGFQDCTSLVLMEYHGRGGRRQDGAGEPIP